MNNMDITEAALGRLFWISECYNNFMSFFRSSYLPCSFTSSCNFCAAASHQLVVLSYWLNNTRTERRAFSVAGPTSWNILLRHLCDPVQGTQHHCPWMFI